MKQQIINGILIREVTGEACQVKASLFKIERLRIELVNTKFWVKSPAVQVRSMKV